MAKLRTDARVTPDNQTYITLEGLRTFKTEYDKKLGTDIKSHTHTPDQIIETPEKKFVSDTEKTRWNDTYTKSETDGKVSTLETKLTDKIDALEKARVWKPSVDTFDKIAETYPEPQDTWCVIAKDTNIMWMYDAEQSKWIDLGHSVIHDNATQDKDGLMSKEDKTKLDGMEQAIATAKQEAIADAQAKDTALEAKITEAYKAEDSKLDGKITAMDAAYKQADTEIRQAFADADTALEEKVTTAYTEAIGTAKEEITNAYTAADTKLKGEIETAYKAADKVIDDKVNAMDTAYKAADTKINETVAAMDTAYKAADQALEGKVTTLTQTHANDKKALEDQIKAVDAKFVSATEEQIKGLFA